MNWMNRKYLKVFASLIFLSMMGLIAIQLYWISSSYNIKEKQFNYQVNKALSETIKTLETQETIFEISNEVFQLADQKDSIVERSVRNFDQSINKYKDDVNTVANRSTVVLSGNKVLKCDSTVTMSDPGISKNCNENAFLKISSIDVKEIIQNKVDNKTLFVEKIVNQILNYNEDILQRLNKVDLEQLLSKNLLEHDIDIPFEYAIKSEEGRVYASKPFKESSSKIYSKQLFPNNLFHDKDFIELYIPGRTTFIVKTMLPIILISIILTLMIIGVVVLNLYIVIKQKKIGEIKNDFVNNLTHELKTPIATISLAGQMLSDKDVRATGNMVERYANIINQESKRLTNQVEKVLQIAMIDKGELKLKNKPVNLVELINKVVEPFILKIENFEGHLDIQLPRDEVIMNVDELHFSNVINNLLDNALKYKLGKPMISIILRNSLSTIELEVADKGMGMPKSEQSKIFDKFYRVERGNIHNIKGFGLGLSYVKKIVDIYEGEIIVKSKINKGSKFILVFPKPNMNKPV